MRLPIRGGHNYADVAGRDSARQQLGDSYVINQSGFNIRTLLPYRLHELSDLTLQQTQMPTSQIVSTLPATTAVPRSVQSSATLHDLSCRRR